MGSARAPKSMLGLAESVQISDLVVWKGGCFLQLSQLEQPSLSVPKFVRDTVNFHNTPGSDFAT